jgi:hypothetical protein
VMRNGVSCFSIESKLPIPYWLIKGADQQRALLSEDGRHEVCGSDWVAEQPERLADGGLIPQPGSAIYDVPPRDPSARPG